MASTVGIHFGARRLQLIQLDGSPKKPKFIRALEGLCPAGEGDEEARFTAGLKLLLKQDKKGWSDENVRVSACSATCRCPSPRRRRSRRS
jgi:hypothetical protein